MANMIKFETNSESETKHVAEKLALLLRVGDVITLEGDLGAGKTTFTKGLAQGLGVKRIVSSPTFTIVKEYSGELPLYHMDVYRLEHSEEDIGFDEYFYGDGISVVEWAHFIKGFLPEKLLNIDVRFVDETKRILTFTATGKHYEHLLNELERIVS